MSNLESGILESILFKWAILEFSAYWQPRSVFLEKLWTIEKFVAPKPMNLSLRVLYYQWNNYFRPIFSSIIWSRLNNSLGFYLKFEAYFAFSHIKLCPHQIMDTDLRRKWTDIIDTKRFKNTSNLGNWTLPKSKHGRS